MLRLTAFNLRALGDVKTVITMARRGGVTTVDELETLIENAISESMPKDKRSLTKRLEEQTKKVAKEDRIPNVKCPLCKQYMKLLPVNDSPETMVGEGYNSCGLCYNPECKHTEYFKETVKEKLEEVGV